MKTIIVFLIIFSIIVVIHEFGHFYFAKKAGIKVREFALGMGPKLFAKQGGDGTTYTVRMLPMGGYVRLAGLNEEDEIEPGMEIGLTLDENNIVQQINLSDTLDQEELPARVNAADLVNDMTLEELIQKDLVNAAKEKDALKLSTLRLVKTEIQKVKTAPGFDAE